MSALAAAAAAGETPAAVAAAAADRNELLDGVREALAPQLKAMGLPEALWSRLVEKLAAQQFDAGASFTYALDDDPATPPHLRYDVIAAVDLAAGEDVWLVDHIWAFPDEAFALEALSTHASVASRMAALMGREDLLPPPAGDADSNADSGANAALPAPGKAVGEQLIDELQRYAYPLFDSAGQRYYYVMDEFGSRVRMAVPPATPADVNVMFGVMQSNSDMFTYTVFWLTKNVEAGDEIRRAPQHRLSLLGRGKKAWETRFEYETAYDWYGGWDDGGGEIRKIVMRHVPLSDEVLIVGTGTSTVPVRMVEEGYASVRATDYVEAVVAKMEGQHGSLGGALSWGVMDARSMALDDTSFDCLFDKGCLDAMLIPEGATGRTSDGASWVHDVAEAGDVVTYLGEAARVLRPGLGGKFVLFSFHPVRAFIVGMAEAAGLQLLHCYEITDANPKTAVKTSATFKHTFNVYVFSKCTAEEAQTVTATAVGAEEGGEAKS